MAAQLAGAPEPNRSSRPLIWVVMSASVVPAGSALVTVAFRSGFAPCELKWFSRYCAPSLVRHMSVTCQLPLNSKVLMAVMFCDGLPCSENPPSTVWLASGVGAYWKLLGL